MAKPLSDADKIASLRLARSENVGPVTFRNLVRIYGTAAAAVKRLPDMARRGGRGRNLKICTEAEAEAEYDALRAMDADVVVAGDPDYPPCLSALPDAVPVLAWKGFLSLAAKPTVAVVGTRNCSLSGKKFARRLSADLAAAGWTVVSGMARGIDAAAHDGALSEPAGGTVAVMGTGIDRTYPPENRKLYDDLCHRGLVFSEFPFGTPPDRLHFPRRNKTLAGIARGVVVVEAEAASGSLITAGFARDMGRTVLAVPGFPLDVKAEGTNRLLAQGATVVTAAADIMRALDRAAPAQAGETGNPFAEAPAAISEEETGVLRGRIVSMLAKNPVSQEDIIAETGAGIRAALIALTELEIAGRILRHKGNAWSLAYDP